MNKRIFRADLLLIVTAAVWGFGFVAQRSGMQYIGPFTFNGIRFILGSLSLLPLAVWRRDNRRKTSAKENDGAAVNNRQENRNLFTSFLVAGTCLFIGVSFQQLGMMATTAGNAGFITGLYVIFTPIFGIFLGRKTGKATWIGAALTFTGLYFLSLAGGFRNINPGDIIVAISAVFWAFHVLVIDRLVVKTDPIELSSGQFAVAGIFSLISAFSIEPLLSLRLIKMKPEFLQAGLFSWKSFPDLLSGLSSGIIPLSLISNALIPVLYGGLVSVGIGYTLQAVAQRDAPPAHATIILCLEGSFAALGGVLLLNEPAGLRTIIGFALMLGGMLVSQWELFRSRR